VCLPLIFLVLAGVWEVGRIAEVSNVMWNAAREAGRDASMGQDNLQAVATNMITYLQGAEPTAFGQGHSTSLLPATGLPASTTGYTCWDTTANRELFTITFTDVTNPGTTDPTGMQRLDQFQIGLQAPYSSVGWAAVPQVSGLTRLSVTVTWASMLDTPFSVSPALPAQ
jgi:Flp pilus assembly protein TadG